MINPKWRIQFFPFFFLIFEISIYLSNDMYLPSVKEISEYFHVGLDKVQLTVIAWFAGSSLLEIIVGPLADKYGYRNMLLLGTIFYTASTFACGISSTIELIVVFRFIEGATVAFVGTCGYAIVHQTYSGKQAIKLITVMTTVSLLAPVIGPIIGAIFVSYGTWQDIFMLLTVLGLLSIVSLYVVTPRIVITERGDKNKSVLKSYWEILSNTKFMGLATLGCCIISPIFIWLLQTPELFLTLPKNGSALFAISQSVVFIGIAFGTLLVRKMIDTIDVKLVIKIGISIYAIGSVSFSILAPLTQSLILATAIMSIIGIGIGISSGPINRLAFEASDGGPGQKSAIYSSMSMVAGFICGSMNTILKHVTIIEISILLSTFTLIAVAMYVRLSGSLKIKESVDTTKS